MQRKSDFEIIVDLNNEVSRLTAFMITMGLIWLALLFIVCDRISQLEDRITQFEAQIELTGDKDE